MTDRPPNLLFVFTDQQSFRMMGCAGNPYVRTPAMDRLAAGGVRFDRAYCTNPVCVPSRFSLLTGRMPGEIGLRANSAEHIDDIPAAVRETGMGRVLRWAGYDALYAGKQHLPKMRAEDLGFDVVTDDQRDGLADTCAELLSTPRDRPFLLAASFINPHDICYFAIRESLQDARERWLVETGRTECATLDEALRLPEGMDEETFFAERCPPAPPNFGPQADEPEIIGELLDQRPFRRRARESWSVRQWRMHRWAYARLTERVDAGIGRVLDALDAGPHAGNTVVVFTSDHGDHDGSHLLEHKTCLYEEAMRVPMIVRAPAGRRGVVEGRLVSNGLDLLPTLCDYAGADCPRGLAGRSLRPLIEGEPGRWRDHLPVDSEFGRAVVSDRCVYARYDRGARREQLYDLACDPYQTRNHAADAVQAEALERHRRWSDTAFGDAR